MVTGYASIDGVDLEAELRTPNDERGRSALRTLMENAKRTATDFLVPPPWTELSKGLCGVIPTSSGAQFCPEEKFLLKGLEGRRKGSSRSALSRIWDVPMGSSDYECSARPHPRQRYPDQAARGVAAARLVAFRRNSRGRRSLWRHSADASHLPCTQAPSWRCGHERAVKHLVDTTDFWNLRTSRLAVILTYLKETTAYLSHWKPYHDHLAALAIGVEHRKA